jgi:chorismate-pyruvate lyase
VDEKISNPVIIDMGVRHGDGLSATFFNLVLHKALKNLKQGNTILNRLIYICENADDILVLARSFPALEALCEKLRNRQSGPGNKPRQD